MIYQVNIYVVEIVWILCDVRLCVEVKIRGFVNL